MNDENSPIPPLLQHQLTTPYYSFSSTSSLSNPKPEQQQQQQQQQQTPRMSETSSQELQSIDDAQAIVDSQYHPHHHQHIGDEDYDEIMGDDDEEGMFGDDDDEDDDNENELHMRKNQNQNQNQKINNNNTAPSSSSFPTTTSSNITNAKPTTRVLTLNNENPNSPDKIIIVNVNDNDIVVDDDVYYHQANSYTKQQHRQQQEEGDGGDDGEIDQDYSRGTKQALRIFRNLMRIGIILSLFALFIGIVVMIVQVIEYTHQRHVNRLTVFLNLGSECQQMAIDLNRELKLMDANNEVNLETVSPPQITLYSAQFLKEDEKEIIESIKYSMINMTSFCNMTLDSNVTVSDAYVLWWISPASPCLQRMSDLIVNATYRYVDRKARYNIPNWVLNIKDEKTREQKSDMIHKYGSPNVFSQFTPHVVLGYDDKTRNSLNQAVARLSVRGCTFGSNLVLSAGRTAKRGLVAHSGVIWTDTVKTIQRSLFNRDGRGEWESLDEDDILFNFNLV